MGRQCSDHARGVTPRYTGKLKPRSGCPDCWAIWEGKEPAAAPQAPAEDPQLLELRAELSLYEREWTAEPEWLRDVTDSHAHRGTLVSFLSDLHAGEIVDPREMRDYNAYNLDICEQRLRRFFERTILVARHYLHGVEYDGLVLPMGGDIVSGDIHEELQETNELSTYETVEWLLPRLRAGIEMLAEEFGKVHVVAAPGNHGRNAKVPRYKKRSANNADTHVARLLAFAMDDEEAITFNLPRSMDARFEVYDYPFDLEHGDEFKGGDGQIGALGPAKRNTIKKKVQTMEEGLPFRYFLIAHFHQYIPAASQEFVMNGSVKGYDEYARGKHFKPEPAQQALMVVTPEHGITVQAPVLVQDRDKEGW